MVRAVELQNFKCFRRQSFELKRLTVLAGRNGSGKSSLVQALMCLRALKRGQGKLDLPTLGLGTLKDIYYQFNQTGDRTIRLAADGDYTFAYQESSSQLDNLSFAFSPVEGGAADDPFLKLRFLAANRVGPMSLHDDSASRAGDGREIGLRGELAVAYLDRHPGDAVESALVIVNEETHAKVAKLKNQVSAWMQRIAKGASVETTSMNDGTHVKLSFRFGDETNRPDFRPENVGVGLSRVLPILVMVLSAKPGDVLVIENPETDLHPRGQTELTSLFAKAASMGVQIILETHSDHIVNGLRLAVRNKVLASSDARVLFFRRIIDGAAHEQFSSVEPVNVDEQGELSRYPKEFLDEWGKTIDQLLGLMPEAPADEEESSGDSESRHV